MRLDHLTDHSDALPPLRRDADTVDTTGIPPSRVAESVISRVNDRVEKQSE